VLVHPWGHHKKEDVFQQGSSLPEDQKARFGVLPVDSVATATGRWVGNGE